MASSNPRLPPDQPIRIAILDDYTNTSLSHFSRLQSLYPNIELTLYPETLKPSHPASLEALVARLEPYRIISSMRERTPFPAALLSRLPHLQLLLNSSRRNKAIDGDFAASRGVLVTGTTNDVPDEQWKRDALGRELPPQKGYAYVVQHAWALVLGLASRVGVADHAGLRKGGWGGEGFCTSLGGKTLGIVGLGRLGSEMARVGIVGFGMEVVAWSENLTQAKADEAMEAVGVKAGVVRVARSKRELLEGADVVSLHYVLSERSQRMIGREELFEGMKEGAFLVNTSRGGLVEEEALIEALKVGRINAALDVFWEEPLPKDSIWRKADEWVSKKGQLIMSPHYGYNFEGLINRMYQEQTEILEKWLKGEDVPNKMN